MTAGRRSPRRRPVSLAIDQAIATITLESPANGNRIDSRLASAFRRVCEEVSADDTVRAVLVVSDGDDFCVGGTPLADTHGRLEQFRVAAALASLPQPVVAALNGAVMDQGLELALAADIRIAADDLRLAMRQVTRDGFPFDGGTQRLPRIAGPALAADLLLTGRELNAGEALSIGIVTEAAPRGELLERARATAMRIATRGATAGRYVKEAVLSGLELTIGQGLRLEADLSILLHGTLERQEGLAGFRSRRRPQLSTGPEGVESQ